MEKLLYLMAGTDHESATTLRHFLLETFPAEVAPLGRFGMTAYLPAVEVDEGPGLQRHNPTGLLNACVAVWVDNVDDHPAIDRVLSQLDAPFAGYVVSESVPVRRPGHARAGAGATPGLGLLAVFGKAPTLDDTSFFRRWSDHSSMSLRVHPLVHYVRNSVLRPITVDAPPWRGIVTEFTANDDDLIDPARFYGSEERQAEAEAHTASFIDSDDFHLEIVREYVIREEPWVTPTPIKESDDER